MAPKTVRVQQQQPRQTISGQGAGGRSSSGRNYMTAAYRELTSPENTSVVRSVVMFGAAVAFLSSSFAEVLLPGS